MARGQGKLSPVVNGNLQDPLSWRGDESEPYRFFEELLKSNAFPLPQDDVRT